MSETAKSYYEERLEKLGITDEHNSINVWRFNTESKENELTPVKVFQKHDKGIKILVYDLKRHTIRIEKEGSRMKDDWAIIRLEKPITKADGSTMKYQLPNGQGSYPFFPPALIEKYEKKEKIECLVLTEGYIKAFKASMHGADVVGLVSITHLKNKETSSLHPDILQLIHSCDVKRIAWLVDGDCLDISIKNDDDKKKTDLYRRPAAFYSTVNTFKQLVDDLDIDKYFYHVDTDGIINTRCFMQPLDQRIFRDQVKGLDDVMLSFPDSIPDIVADLPKVSKSSEWFVKMNINVGLSKVREYFRINNVTNFYLYHAERQATIKGKEFIFNGTTYKYNEDTCECDVMVPGDASKYLRVGDQYFKFISPPDQNLNEVRIISPRQKTTITDDHGKKIIQHIQKFEAFCNVPSHDNYQNFINNCFNVYAPFEHTADENECTEEDIPNIVTFLKHVFGTDKKKVKQTNGDLLEVPYYYLALDYIQLLYKSPVQRLPILCLVSKENETGKSTFADLLKAIFTNNAAIVGNQDLADDFNSFWATKLLVMCDETKIDKQAVVERIKALTFQKKIAMNSKGKDKQEIDFFAKFILMSNNEDSFIYASEEDKRYWVVKVPKLKERNPDFLANMIDEIPALISYLNKRKMVTSRESRMWFDEKLLVTPALKRVIENSKPNIVKEVSHYIREAFKDFGQETILMSRMDLHEEITRISKYEANYLERTLKEDMKLKVFSKDSGQKDMFGEPILKYVNTRYSYSRWGKIIKGGVEEPVRVDVPRNGRPYIFHRSDFLSEEEIQSIEVSPEDQQLNQLTVQPGEAIDMTKADTMPFPSIPYNK